MTHGLANELTLRNKAKLVIKLLIAIRGNYGYLAGWTYPLKIYRKRSQFANKSIICNDAFPLFCEVHLKGQLHLKGQPPLLVPQDVTSRLRQEQSLRQPPGLVGQERRGTGAAAPAKAPAKTKGVLTPAGRRKLSQLMKARWAARRKAGGTKKASKRKRGALTPAGRKRLSELMKARWAARRKGVQNKQLRSLTTSCELLEISGSICPTRVTARERTRTSTGRPIRS